MPALFFLFIPAQSPPQGGKKPTGSVLRSWMSKLLISVSFTLGEEELRNFEQMLKAIIFFSEI